MVCFTTEELFYEQLEIQDDGKIKSTMAPVWIRVYDNGGESADRYTVVFTGNYPGRNGCDYVSLSADPTSILGVCMHGWHDKFIDRPTYIHLGKSIKFKDLPEDCQNLVLKDYQILWDIV